MHNNNGDNNNDIKVQVTMFRWEVSLHQFIS
jgi:hypothetical protein